MFDSNGRPYFVYCDRSLSQHGRVLDPSKRSTLELIPTLCIFVILIHVLGTICPGLIGRLAVGQETPESSKYGAGRLA